MNHLRETVVLSHSLVAKTVWPRAVVDSGRFVTRGETPWKGTGKRFQTFHL